jgi:putative PEP-CTERM system TPR-repeat lipoprotein
MPFVSLSRYPRPLISLVLTALGTFGLIGCTSSSSSHYLDRAKTLMEKKQYDRALLELKNAAKADPRGAEPYYQAGLAYLAMGDYQTAYRTLIHATEVDPKHTAAQLKVAELIGSSAASTTDPKTLAEAEQRVQSALAIVPDNADALTALGLTQYLLGKPADAVKHLEAALEKFPQQLQAAKTLAVIKLNQKDFSGAEQILKKVAEASPRSPEGQVALARFYIMNRRISDAEIAYRRALAIDPKYGTALLDLAQLQLGAARKEDAEKTLVALSALPDKQYRPLHAIYLFEQGRHAEALQEFEQQAKTDPNDRDAFQRLTSAYFFTKRFPDAERAINAALKQNPKNIDALIARSQVYIITAKFSEAQVDLNQVLKFQHDSATAHYLLSKVHQARGEQPQRRDQLGEAVQLDPNLLIARIELAETLVAIRAAKNALQILDQTPKTQAQMLPVILERNWALLSADDRAELRKNIDRGLGLYGNAPDLLLQDGLLRLENKDFAGCRKSLELALSARPQDIRAVDALAKSYALQKRPDIALQTVVHYASRAPTFAPIQNLLGQWLAANNRYSEARTAFTKALAADPALEDARLSSAYVDIYEGKLESAKQTLESVVRSPKFAVQGYFALAVADERAGNASAAIVHYRKVLEADPDNVPALNNLAYHLTNDTNQFDEALRYAQKAKELAPSSVLVDDTIGWAFYRKGLYGPAVEYLERAIGRQATALSKYHLAMAYLKTGSQQRGTQMLAEARRMDASLPELVAAQALIERVDRNAK